MEELSQEPKEIFGVPQSYSNHVPFGFRVTEYSWRDRPDFWIEICDIKRDLVTTILISKEYPRDCRRVIVKMSIEVHRRRMEVDEVDYEDRVNWG